MDPISGILFVCNVECIAYQTGSFYVYTPDNMYYVPDFMMIPRYSIQYLPYCIFPLIIKI